MKNALVTGAGMGIGRAIALGLAKAGYNVILHYNSSPDGAISAAKEAEAFGVQTYMVCANLIESVIIETQVYNTRKERMVPP